MQKIFVMAILVAVLATQKTGLSEYPSDSPVLPVEFLETHVTVKEDLGFDNISYLVEECQPYVYVLVSNGTIRKRTV